MNLTFGELWLDLSQASFASDQVAVHLDAKFGEVHIRLPHDCVIGCHWNFITSVICEGGSFFESDIKTKLKLGIRRESLLYGVGSGVKRVR